jgi:hypothetical protein
MSARIFGLTEQQMHDPAYKELPLKAPLAMDLFVGVMSQETGLCIRPAGKVAHSPREVMQFFGTEYVRACQDDYWVQQLLQESESSRRVLVPDTRFDNEAAALRAVGGKVIKIVRIDSPAQGDGHVSETEQANINPDLVIGVRTGDLSLPRRAAMLIALGKFNAAQRYDYRAASKAIEAYLGGASAEDSAQLLGQGHKHPYALLNLLDYYGVPRRKQPKSRVGHRMIEGVVQKHCSSCVTWHPLASFNASSKAWDGLAGLCRSCASLSNKSRYQKYAKVDSLGAIFAMMKRNASSRGLSFDLTLSDVEALWEKQKGVCAYSGQPMTFTLSDPQKVSLDRVNSAFGYHKDNVVLCTVRVNLMKRDMSLDEFRATVKAVAQTLVR